jgi:hypothetical protein
VVDRADHVIEVATASEPTFRAEAHPAVAVACNTEPPPSGRPVISNPTRGRRDAPGAGRIQSRACAPIRKGRA